MKTLEKHMQSLGDPPFSLPPKLASCVKSQFQHQWRMMKTNLHYVRAFLNPYLLGNNMIHDDVNAKEGIKRVLWKMLVDATSYVQALTNFANLAEGQGPFADIPATTSLNIPLHEWWGLIGTSARTFAPIAKCILAQVCSTSSCERNWNSYSFVHSKMQNCLTYD